MSSLLRSTRQVSENIGYYIPVADCRTKLYAYNPVDGQSTFSTVSWACQAAAGAGFYSSLVAGPSVATGILKDLGKTVVSSTRVFRRVQLVAPNGASTFGVAGQVSTTWPQQDFLTAYIELGFEGGGVPTPVAQFGR